MMESTRKIRKNHDSQPPTKLQNLSPEKYGGAAMEQLFYTPGKLADNILYRQANTLKRVQINKGQVREFEAFNEFFKQKLGHLNEQKHGIESALNQQIAMYRKIIQEMESSHETQLISIQQKFRQEITIIIKDKEEEVKYVQSEKEILEKRIQELEEVIRQLDAKLNSSDHDFVELNNSHEKLQLLSNNLQQNLTSTEDNMRKAQQKAQHTQQELKQQIENVIQQSKQSQEQLTLRKNLERDTLEANLRSDIDKIEQRRESQQLQNGQEVRELTSAFEGQLSRLNETISMKQRMIESITQQNRQQKVTILELNSSYEKEITFLSYQCNRVKQELERKSCDSIQLRSILSMEKDVNAREKAELECLIASLREEVEQSQINYIRQKDKAQVLASEHEHNVIHLELSERHLKIENDHLLEEIQKLRELLCESANEMAMCKEEFMRLAVNNEELLIKIEGLEAENQHFQQVRHSLEQEAQMWRRNYYQLRS